MSVFVFVFLITHSCWFPPFSSFQLPPRPGHCSTSWFKTTITARSFFSFTHILFAFLSIQSIPEYKKISNLRHGLEKSNLILHSHPQSFFLQCFSIRILHSIFCDCSFQLNTYCIQFLCHLWPIFVNSNDCSFFINIKVALSIDIRLFPNFCFNLKYRQNNKKMFKMKEEGFVV